MGQNMKTVLITGASRGIGAEIAKQAIKKYNVVVCYNNSEEKARKLVEELKEVGNAIALKVDVTKFNQVKKCVEDAKQYFSKIDALVNCAGISEQKLFLDTSETDWKKMFSSNLDSAFYFCKEILPDMISNGGGSIVNIASMWGETGASCEVGYSASKAGLIGFTKALAKEYALSNIKVNAVSPGAIMTDMMAKLGKETIKMVKEETPLNKIGSADEVAKAVMFLLDSEFVTGEILRVNGGFLI